MTTDEMKARVVIDVAALTRPKVYGSPEEARSAAIEIRLDFERRLVDPFRHFKRRFGRGFNASERHKRVMELSAETKWAGEEDERQIPKPEAV